MDERTKCKKMLGRIREFDNICGPEYKWLKWLLDQEEQLTKENERLSKALEKIRFMESSNNAYELVSSMRMIAMKALITKEE